MRLARQQPFATSILESAIYLNVKQPTWRDSDHILQSNSLGAPGSGRMSRPLPAPFVLRSELLDDPIHHHSQ